MGKKLDKRDQAWAKRITPIPPLYPFAMTHLMPLGYESGGIMESTQSVTYLISIHLIFHHKLQMGLIPNLVKISFSCIL